MHLKSRTTHLAYEKVEGYPRPADLSPLSDLESYIQEYAEQAHISKRTVRFLFR